MDEFLDDFLMGNDDDVFDAIILQGASNIVPASTLLLAESTNMEETKADHTGRRKSRRRFDHAAIRDKLYSHFLGPGPLHGSQFKQHFRISFSTFEYIFQRIMNSGDPYYSSNFITDLNQLDGPVMPCFCLVFRRIASCQWPCDVAEFLYFLKNHTV